MYQKNVSKIKTKVSKNVSKIKTNVSNVSKKVSKNKHECFKVNMFQRKKLSKKFHCNIKEIKNFQRNFRKRKKQRKQI
jgi:hypothetical protein